MYCFILNIHACMQKVLLRMSFHLNQVVKIMPFEIPTDPIQTSKNFFLIIWCGRIFFTKAKYNYVSHDSEKIQWSKKDIFYQALSSKRKIIFLTIYLIMHALLIIISYNYNDWCLPKTSSINIVKSLNKLICTNLD